MDPVGERVTTGAKDIGTRRIPPETDGNPAVPAPSGCHGRPANVAVVVTRDAPGNPGVRVTAPSYPCPTSARHPDPAAVMKDHAAERVVALPKPIAIVGQRPVASADVRCKISADRIPVGHPNRAVLRVVHPAAIRIERGTKLGDRTRIRILLVDRRCGGGLRARGRLSAIRDQRSRGSTGGRRRGRRWGGSGVTRAVEPAVLRGRFLRERGATRGDDGQREHSDEPGNALIHGVDHASSSRLKQPACPPASEQAAETVSTRR